MGVALIVRKAWGDIDLLPISCCSGDLSVLNTLSMTQTLFWGKKTHKQPILTSSIYTTASYQQEVFWHQRKLLAPENPNPFMVQEWISGDKTTGNKDNTAPVAQK